MSNKKQYLWLPNTNSITIANNNVTFKYKGGEVKTSFKEIHSIMFYAKTCNLSQDFLDKCTYWKIPIVMHRRTMAKATWIVPSTTTNNEDLLTKQILFRENLKKRSYIAKKLLLAKFQSMEWLQPSAENQFKYVTSIKEMTLIESWHAKEYWKKYYKALKITGHSRRSETNENQAKKILDAVSKFMSGILLRWIHYHHLSPFHGFIHIPTEYEALVYDLMEPYRGYIDLVVFKTILTNSKQKKSTNELIAYAIEDIKEFLDTQVYIVATNQIVTFHELYHGIVLSLRSYLLENKRFIVPMPGFPNGGRPVNAGYKLYGREAGITNFWSDTKELAKRFDNYTNLKKESIQTIIETSKP